MTVTDQNCGAQSPSDGGTPLHSRNHAGIALRCVALLTAIVACVGHRALAADWPQWRGPTRDGVVPAANVPQQWPEELKKTWEQKVGIGHSSPIVVGKRVFQFSRLGDDEVLQAFDLTKGTPLWKMFYPAAYEVDSAAADHGKGPKSTPTFSDGRIYTFGINGRLTCWDAAKGGKIWDHDFVRDFPKPSPQFGTAASPLLLNGLCIVHGGGTDGGSLTAFDAATGAIKWQNKDVRPAYASPVVTTIDGVEQLITQTQDSCLSVDVKTGVALWSIPFETQYEQSSVTPVIADGKVIFGGYQKPTFAITARRDGEKWTTKKLWSNAELPLYMNTPVVSGQFLFGMTQRRAGQLFCADINTGKTRWTNEGRFGENASLLLVGKFILALSIEGRLEVIENTPREFKKVQSYQLSESFIWASPAIVDSLLLVKDQETLMCFERPK